MAVEDTFHLTILSDGVSILIWLATSGFACFAAWKWCAWIFPRETGLVRLIHVQIMLWAGLALLSFMLGAFGLLSGAWLLLCGAVSAFAALVVLARVSSSPLQEKDKQCSAETLWSWFWCLLLAIAIARSLGDAVINTPADWDTLTYHLPLVVQWLHKGSLYVPADAFWYNPANAELWTLWLVAPFSGDFFHGLTNLFPTVLLVRASVELSRALGARPFLAHLSGFAMISTWPVFQQLVTTENDVAAASLFIASAFYVVRHLLGGRFPDLLFACASIGLLVGVKYYALGYAALATVGLLGLTAARRGASHALRSAVCCVCGILLFGSYWYLRNFVVTGSPVFPKGITAEDDLWAEMRPESWSSTLFGANRGEAWVLALRALHSMAGPWHLAGLFLTPVICLWFCISSYRTAEESRGVASARVFVGLMCLGSFVVLGSTPNFVEFVPGTLDMLTLQYLPARFGLCFLALVVIVFVVGLSDLFVALSKHFSHPTKERSSEGKTAIAFCLLLTTVVGVQFGMHWFKAVRGHWEAQILLTANLSLLFLVAWLIQGMTDPLRRAGLFVFRLSLVIIAIVGTALVSHNWHDNFDLSYSTIYSPDLLAMARTQGADDSVCICDYRYYPFFGSYRQLSAYRPLWLPTAASLIAYLKERQLRLVVALERGRDRLGRYARVRDWLNERPEFFTLLWTDGVHCLFKAESRLWE